MAKIKIGDLAKELGVENKAVIAYLQEQGVTSAKVWNSSIEEDEAAIARRHFGAGEAPADEKKAAAKKPAAKDAAVKKVVEKAPEKKAVAPSEDQSPSMCRNSTGLLPRQAVAYWMVLS